MAAKKSECDEERKRSALLESALRRSLQEMEHIRQFSWMRLSVLNLADLDRGIQIATDALNRAGRE